MEMRGIDPVPLACKASALPSEDTDTSPKCNHPGLEPESQEWKSYMLPLHQWCFNILHYIITTNTFFLFI